MDGSNNPDINLDGVPLRRGKSTVRVTRDGQMTDIGAERHLNQYIIKGVIGSGAFGTVHLSVDTKLNREVAIKEFSKMRLKRNLMAKIPGAGMGGGFRGRFGRGRGGLGRGGGPGMSHTPARAEAVPEDPIDLVRGEIVVLKKLKHKHIVKLYEVLDDPTQDSLYMVFELCEEGTLMDVSLTTTAVPFSNEEARFYFRQIVLGIEYLHEHDIAHRDIKPDNLLISTGEVIKIVDFGVSEIFSPGQDKSRKSAGSPAFTAPEMCAPHHGELSAKATDIWAMGVTLYCCVFGHLPFAGSSIIDLYQKIREEPVPIADGTNEDLADLLRRMMEKDPEARIKLNDVRDHPWLTRSGRDPLISKEQNCVGVVKPEDITDEDLKGAVSPVGGLFAALKFAAKLKKARSNSRLNSISSAGSSSANSSVDDMQARTPVTEGSGSDSNSASATNMLSAAPITYSPKQSPVLNPEQPSPASAFALPPSSSSSSNLLAPGGFQPREGRANFSESASSSPILSISTLSPPERTDSLEDPEFPEPVPLPTKGLDRVTSPTPLSPSQILKKFVFFK
ncbi:kinase-like domain-containing protein [Cladochytrium replicatum]|nr:kinase-like domain-containing protein [Cladochytrium replicatum]